MKILIPSLTTPPRHILPASPPPESLPAPIFFPPLSRRLLLALSLSSLPFPSLSSALPSPFPCSSSSPAITSKAFLDVSIAGEQASRITVGLFGDASPAGASRFSALASGSAGISYRRKEFSKIAPTYIQHAGIRSYGAESDLARRSGVDLAADNLISEFTARERCEGVRSVRGMVGIVVRNPARGSPSTKIVARKGRIEVEEDKVEGGPNGTEFVIATSDSPEMDDVALVVGKVVDGMEVVDRIAGVSAVKDNTGSPYFRVAKLIGDKRAVVAERGFNRPYVKVLITGCGLLMD